MGEQGRTYHVKGATAGELVKLLEKLPKPSEILDTKSERYLPFITSAKSETLPELIPFPLIDYGYHDGYGFGVYGYFEGRNTFSIVVDWGGKPGQIWKPGDPFIVSQKFDRPSDKELIETGFFDSPEEIANLARVVENSTHFDGGLTNKEWNRGILIDRHGSKSTRTTRTLSH